MAKLVAGVGEGERSGLLGTKREQKQDGKGGSEVGEGSGKLVVTT